MRSSRAQGRHPKGRAPGSTREREAGGHTDVVLHSLNACAMYVYCTNSHRCNTNTERHTRRHETSSAPTRHGARRRICYSTIAERVHLRVLSPCVGATPSEFRAHAGQPQAQVAGHAGEPEVAELARGFGAGTSALHARRAHVLRAALAQPLAFARVDGEAYGGALPTRSRAACATSSSALSSSRATRTGPCAS